MVEAPGRENDSGARPINLLADLSGDIAAHIEILDRKGEAAVVMAVTRFLAEHFGRQRIGKRPA